MKQIIPYLFLGIIGLTLACMPVRPAANSCNIHTNMFGQRVMQYKLPVLIYINKDVPEQYRNDIKDALDVWNDSLAVPVFKYAGIDLGPTFPRGDAKNVVYWITTWNDGENKQAVAKMQYRGDEIYDTDIVVNADNFAFFPSDDVDPSKVHFRTLMVHELGHVLGFEHMDSEPSVMNFSLGAGEIRDVLFPVDLNNLHCAYK